MTSIPSISPSAHEEDLIQEASEKALKIIQKNISARGLAASIDNYPQIWARDTVITFLGATVVEAPDILEAFRISLETLGSAQNRFGQIPNLIQVSDGKVSFGSCDSTIWYVAGCCLYAERSGDRPWLAQRHDSIRKALDWCEMRDFYACGLISSLEADDWADLLCHRGHVLFTNTLLVWALRLAAGNFGKTHPEDSAAWSARAVTMTAAIREMFWVAPLGSFVDHSHVQVRAQMSIRLRKLPYFIPWINLFEFGERFDTPGNLLAILSGVAEPDQAASILGYIEQEGLDQPFPIRTMHPVIRLGDADWRDYYMVWGHGQPYHYQNGGIWPWAGGLYIAALVKAGRLEKAAKSLHNLASALRLGKEEAWEFNENYHGMTGKPMGAKYQAWSAGMFLYARHCVEKGSTPDFRK